MNFFKRAWLSVTRRKGKSLILFAVIFILGNVIAGAIAIQQSTGNVEKNVKKQLGATATLEVDYMKYQKEFESGEVIIDALPLKTIKKVGESPYVKYYDFNANHWISTRNLKSVQQEESDGSVVMGGVLENSFDIKGVNYPKLLDIEEGNINLVDGTVFTEADIEQGKNSAIISAQVAELNNLSVGDQMVIDQRGIDYSTEEAKELFQIDLPVQVIGIFEPTKLELEEKNKNSQQYYEQQFYSQQQQNTIYMANKAVLETSKAYFEKDRESQPAMYEGEEGSRDDEYYQPLYVLKDSEDVEAFRQEIDPILPQYYHVVASSDQYDQIAGSMKKLSQISGYVVIIAVAAALLIISLVVLLFMRDRKHELGIYLSLGDRRSKVMGQIVIEMLLISAVALVLSLVTGNFLGKLVSDSLLASDVLNQTNNDYMYYGFASMMGNSVTADDVLNSYEVKFTLGYIISYLVIGLGTVVLSAILPLVYILRLNPKKIMM